MTFTEEWFGPASCEALADLARLTAHVDGSVIEVGCWEGRSTLALADAVAPQTVEAIDTWAGSPGEISADLASVRDVFATFCENTAGKNIAPHRMGWREYRQDGPVRFLHIDAEHTYEEVADTIDAFLPLLAAGGIICGDDVHHEPVQRAVLERFPDARTAASLWWWQKPGNLRADYERMCATPSDINLHLPRMVELVETLNAQHVIELGTRTGVSTIAWLYALEQTGGRLTSVDIDTQPPIGEYDHWTFVRGSDLDPAVIASLGQADIVFIDTSHLYEHTVAELNIYRHLVRPGGVICLHDTQLPRPEGAPAFPQYPVRKAVLEFIEAEGYRWIEYPDCWGFAVIEVA